eukprot:SAG31_NODE_3923_length_3749_cov_2.030685_2_plen_246_part_00
MHPAGPLSSEEVASLSQEEVELNLTLLGLILFRNELKPDTTEAIRQLKAGDVRPIMITGDNAQCGFYIAQQCGMLDHGSEVLLGDNRGGGLQWSKMGTDAAGWQSLSVAEVVRRCEEKGSAIELALTGKAFALLKDRPRDMDTLLMHVRIFARTSPTQKVEACKLHVERGFITGMCGDGGNDAGALRAAHVGVALSDAEASVVSPFTSKSKTVQSVVELLREGRGALVTSFAGYKFLITEGKLTT